MPSRMGMKLSPVFHSMILISPKAIIERPRKLDTSNVIKADVLKKTIDDKFEANGFFTDIKNLSRFVSIETVKDIGYKLISLHKPATFDYGAKFGISTSTSNADTNENLNFSKVRVLRPRTSAATLQCKHCNSEDMVILKSRYGYYFKCNSCNKTTSINVNLCENGHKERIRKEGHFYFRECVECKTCSLFFQNPLLAENK